MPTVVQDDKIRDGLVQSLKTKYEKERVGIHLTDLICPRLTYFRKVNGDELDERDVVFYALGSGEGEVIEQLLGRKSEIMIIKDGIIHTVDSLTFEDEDMVPVEIKTTRSERAEKVEDVVRPHYLFQLGAYCSALSVRTGILIVLMLNLARVKVFRVTYSDRELQEIRGEILRRRDLLIKGLEERDPTIVPSVMNDPDLNWKCDNCRFREECEEAERGWRRFKFVQPLIQGKGYEAKLVQTLEKYKADLLAEYKVHRDQENNVVAVSVKGTDDSVRDVRRLCEWINERLIEVNLSSAVFGGR